MSHSVHSEKSPVITATEQRSGKRPPVSTPSPPPLHTPEKPPRSPPPSKPAPEKPKK
jgi:hypothetical protein